MPGPKINNNRKYPDADRQPRHVAHLRIAEAKERQLAYDKLSLEEKMAKLPPEPRCAKQRAKLLLKIEKRNQKPAPKAVEAQLPVTETAPLLDKQSKKYMKNANKQ